MNSYTLYSYFIKNRVDWGCLYVRSSVILVVQLEKVNVYNYNVSRNENFPCKKTKSAFGHNLFSNNGCSKKNPGKFECNNVCIYYELKNDHINKKNIANFMLYTKFEIF